MKARTLIHALSLTVVALCVGLLMMIVLSPVAKSDGLEPSGFADAQRAALWKAVIEGPGNGPIMTGWLQKKNWANGSLTYLEKRFWARMDRTCADVKPECFRCVGIWSGNELLAYLGGE
jgi:hypothetical protein